MSKKKDKKAKKTVAAAGNATPGFFGNLGVWLSKHPSEQFLAGILLGAAAAYVLSNDELRGKAIKGGVNLYSALACNFAEFREQIADVMAEVEAEKAFPDASA
ncbi:MAG: hypothetical protein LBG69_03480 [Zoogloeaceae bacterium]|jgi:hypothetical protein|nr:hypothetical protein [Zoogloeaceae bacterium]